MADTSNNIPSQHPAQQSGMAEAFRGIVAKYMQQVDGMLPATVISYNRLTGRATVAPSVNMVSTSGQAVSRAPIANIKVLAIGGGDFLLTFPVKPGDTGWIEASDRDISLWLQGGGKSAVSPNTHRTHSFSDGRFIPDAMFNFTLPADAENGVCLQHKDGQAYIILNEDTIHLNAPNGVFINNIRMDTHRHSGVEPGAGNTGTPT